jgi:DNA-binding NarL/FixJ family response regulator
MRTTVLLVDDHELIRDGLSRAIERDGRLTVVAQAATVSEAFAAYQAWQPAVVVTDLRLPDGSGIDLVRRIRAERDDVGLVVLTMHALDVQLKAAVEAGASAFLGKDTPGRTVVETAVNACRSPHSFVGNGLAQLMALRSTTSLSRREREVLELLADGLGTPEMAARMFLGESTVKTYVTRLYQKLGVDNRTQAVLAGVRSGLLLDKVAV